MRVVLQCGTWSRKVATEEASWSGDKDKGFLESLFLKRGPRIRSNETETYDLDDGGKR